MDAPNLIIAILLGLALACTVAQLAQGGRW